MALDASTLARRIVDSFVGRRYRSAFPFWRDVLQIFNDHWQSELELVNFDKAWDNFDKADLNTITYTEEVTRGSGDFTYTIGNTTDVLLLQNTTAGAGNYTISLPATPFVGQRVTIKDSLGNASGRNIIVSGNGRNIDGSPSITISADWGVARLYSNGVFWFLI